MKRCLIGGAALFFAAALGAATLAGVTMPDTVPVSGRTLKLNGLGLRTKFFFKIYVGGLYLETPTHDAARAIAADETKRVVMHFLYKHVTTKELVDAWNDGFEGNAGTMGPELKSAVARFESWMSDVNAEQEIVATYVPGTGTSIEIAGQTKGTIPGAEFMQALWKVWLGPHPPTADLKKGMLGNS